MLLKAIKISVIFFTQFKFLILAKLKAISSFFSNNIIIDVLALSKNSAETRKDSSHRLSSFVCS